jgi:hypothetical protein
MQNYENFPSLYIFTYIAYFYHIKSYDTDCKILFCQVYSTWEEAFTRLNGGAISENSDQTVKIISERGIQK